MATPEPAVTISASYGAGGSRVAPRLAERLGVPMVDRLLSADVSEEAARSGESLSDHEASATPGRRLFVYLARASAIGAVSAPPLELEPDDELRQRAEAGLDRVRAGEAAVVLGRAGAVVLANRPRTLHVRLDGPTARRVAVAARIEGIPEARAADRLAQTDRSRLLWVKRLYQADARNPDWYHLWLDTTVLGLDATVDLIAATLDRFLSGRGTDW